MLLEIFKANLCIFDWIFYISASIGLIGILVDSMFNYPLRYATYVFIISVIIGKIYSKYIQVNIKKINFTLNMNLGKKRFYLLLIAILVFIISINISYKKNMSEKSFKNAIMYEGKDRLDRTWFHLKKAIEYWPYRSSNLIYGTAICYENYKVNKSDKNYREIVEYNNLALANLPYHFIPNYIKVNLLLDRNNWKKEKKINDKVRLLLDVTPRGNRKTQTMQTVAYLAYLKGEYKISLDLYKKLRRRTQNEQLTKRIKILRKLITENDAEGANK